MALQCRQCGHESTFMHPRAVYSCKAPHCQAQGVPFCYACLIKMGAPKDALGNPERCPVCNVGELRYLGNK
jgi:hypothetical protein